MEKRKVTKEIIIHCSATPEGKDYTVEDIRRWHLKRGFKDIGYHYIIYRDGSVHVGRNKDLVGAHCEGHNAISIGICYIGGVRPLTPKASPPNPLPDRKGEATADAKKKHTTMIGGKEYVAKDTRTPEQKDSMMALIEQLREEYPGVTIHGHNEFARKACPSFLVPDEL